MDGGLDCEEVGMWKRILNEMSWSRYGVYIFMCLVQKKL